MHPIPRFARASAAAYLNGAALERALDPIGLTLLEARTDAPTDSQAYAARDGSLLVLAFRGTDGFQDALRDADIALDDFDGHRLMRGAVSVHAGFLGAWLALRDWADGLSQHYADGVEDVVVCGHSLGGAIATLAASDIWALPRPRAFTYGSPRVGLGHFAEAYDAMKAPTVRVVHDEDIVPTVPALPYAHVSGLLHLGDQGEVLGGGSWLRSILGFGRRVVSRLDFEAVRDHHVDRYVAACDAYAARQAAIPQL